MALVAGLSLAGADTLIIAERGKESDYAIVMPDEYFWMGPGRFTSDGKSAIKGVYLDKIKFTLVE